METWCFLGILFSLPHNKADVYLRAALMCFIIITRSREIITRSRENITRCEITTRSRDNFTGSLNNLNFGVECLL